MSYKDFEENLNSIGYFIVFLAVLYLLVGIFWSFTAANIIFGIIGVLIVALIVYIIVLKIRLKRAKSIAEANQLASTENVPSVADKPKRITCEDFQQYKYLAKIRGLTDARIEKYNILDGDPVTAEYSIADKSDKKRFIVKINDISFDEAIIGSIDDKDAEKLFQWYSHESFVTILHGEIVEREDENGISKFYIELTTPYNIHDEDFPFYTKLVDTQSDDKQKYLRDCYITDAVLIKHSPAEECPEKTTVTHISTGECLGCIESDTAKGLIDVFGNNRSYNGIIASKNDKNGIIDCNIQFISLIKNNT